MGWEQRLSPPKERTSVQRPGRHPTPARFTKGVTPRPSVATFGYVAAAGPLKNSWKYCGSRVLTIIHCSLPSSVSRVHQPTYFGMLAQGGGGGFGPADFVIQELDPLAKRTNAIP